MRALIVDNHPHIEEAVDGEGALALDAAGVRFYHPERASKKRRRTILPSRGKA
jgi:hypothetical protein